MLTLDLTKLRAARGDRRKEAVALAIGRSWSSLTAYENGIVKPSLSVVLALADLYETTVESFCTDDTEPSS